MKDALIRILTRRDTEAGQALAEFAMIIGFVAIVCIAALTVMGGVVTAPLEEFMDLAGFGGS